MVIRLQAGKSRNCGSIPSTCQSPSSLVCNGSCFPWRKAGGREEPHLCPVSFPSSIGSIPWVGLDLTFSVAVKMRTTIPTLPHALMCIKRNNLAITLLIVDVML